MPDGYNYLLNSYHNCDHYTMWMDQKIKVDASYSTWIYKYEPDNKQPTSDSFYQTWENKKPY